MARTEIPLATVGPFLESSEISTAVNGDAANDMYIDVSRAPKIHLVVKNTGANTVAFTMLLTAGESSFNEALTISYSMTGFQWMAVPLDIPPDLWQTSNQVHIDSVDANFADLEFIAITWNDTPLGD